MYSGHNSGGRLPKQKTWNMFASLENLYEVLPYNLKKGALWIRNSRISVTQADGQMYL